MCMQRDTCTLVHVYIDTSIQTPVHPDTYMHISNTVTQTCRHIQALSYTSMQSKVFRDTLVCTDSQLHTMEHCPLGHNEIAVLIAEHHRRCLQDWTK